MSNNFLKDTLNQLYQDIPSLANQNQAVLDIASTISPLQITNIVNHADLIKEIVFKEKRVSNYFAAVDTIQTTFNLTRKQSFMLMMSLLEMDSSQVDVQLNHDNVKNIFIVDKSLNLIQQFIQNVYENYSNNFRCTINEKIVSPEIIWNNFESDFKKKKINIIELGIKFDLESNNHPIPLSINLNDNPTKIIIQKVNNIVAQYALSITFPELANEEFSPYAKENQKIASRFNLNLIEENINARFVIAVAKHPFFFNKEKQEYHQDKLNDLIFTVYNQLEIALPEYSFHCGFQINDKHTIQFNFSKYDKNNQLNKIYDKINNIMLKSAAKIDKLKRS